MFQNIVGVNWRTPSPPAFHKHLNGLEPSECRGESAELCYTTLLHMAARKRLAWRA